MEAQRAAVLRTRKDDTDTLKNEIDSLCQLPLSRFCAKMRIKYGEHEFSAAFDILSEWKHLILDEDMDERCDALISKIITDDLSRKEFIRICTTYIILQKINI